MPCPKTLHMHNAAALTCNLLFQSATERQTVVEAGSFKKSKNGINASF